MCLRRLRLLRRLVLEALYVHTYMYVSIFGTALMYRHVHTCTAWNGFYVHTYMYMYMYMYMYIHVQCMYVHVHVCMYIHVQYMYINVQNGFFIVGTAFV